MSAQVGELTVLPATDGMVCYVRHVPTSWVIRLMPWRDPDQPRFWCLRMQLSTGASLAARTAGIDPYYIALAMSRQELTETLALIRSDPEGWFNQATLDPARGWLAQAVQTPLPPPPAPPATAVRPRAERTPSS